jgi:rubrerythrin
LENKKPHIEILELAISREIEAINLYLAMAEFFVEKDISRVFIDIANEEMQHKNDLELEVMKLGRTIEIERDFASVAVSGFNLGDMLRAMDHKNLLSMAINKEEEAFRFYVDMLESVKDHQSREFLYALAQEEAIHKHRFEIEYELLSKKSS